MVNEIHRHADIGVRYGLTKSDVTLMMKTICRDCGRNTRTSERNVKSGKRPKSQSPSESPGPRVPPSRLALVLHHPPTTPLPVVVQLPPPLPSLIQLLPLPPPTKCPSATRRSTPDDLGDDLDNDLDDDLDDDDYEVRPRISSRQYPGYIPVRKASSRNFKL